MSDTKTFYTIVLGPERECGSHSHTVNGEWVSTPIMDTFTVSELRGKLRCSPSKNCNAFENREIQFAEDKVPGIIARIKNVYPELTITVSKHTVTQTSEVVDI